MNIAFFLWFLGFGITYSGVLAIEKCPRDNLDIFIVLDGSESINKHDFERIRTFLTSLVGQFKIGEFESRVGLMQFSNKFRTVIEFDFGKHKTTKAIQDNIKSLVHQYGDRTYAGHALKQVNEEVFPESGNTSSSARPDAEKILLLVTDGQPHDPEIALKEADKLKKKGVHLITVGAGTEKWMTKVKLILNRLGSKPTQNHQEEFRYLKRITKKLVKDICGSKERQPAPPHKCFQEKKDILIMLDGSKSVGKRNFYKMRAFLQDFLSRVDIGESRLHVSVIQFSERHKTSIEIALNQYLSVEDLVTAVAKLMYQQGKEADLFNALRRAELMVLNGGGGDRLTAPDTIIIFTDGNYNDEGVPELLAKLREKKARIVSVGVGSNGKQFNQKKVDALAIGTGDVYDLTTLEASVFVEDIAPSTCKMTSCTTTAPKCSPENQDVLFLFDGSSRIGSASFRLGQRFIKRLIEKMTLGKDTTHVGVMQYGSAGRVTHVSRLDKDNLRSQVGDQISRMVYMDEGRSSDLAYALSIASDTLLNPSKKGRESVSKTMVLVTDGDIKEFSEVHSMAQTLRNKGIRIIALSNGVKSKYKTYESSLRLVASGPKEYYRLENSQFNEVLKELQKTVCISEPLIPETCFTQRRRVFFALDSSGGRGRKKFKEVKDFMESLVTKLQISLSNSQVGFLQYDDLTTSKYRVVFEKNVTVDRTLWRIKNMKYRKGRSSYLGNALKIVNDEVYPHGTDRHDEYKDLLIIISHKEITDAQLAFDEAEKLKDKGVEIISVATGNRKKVENIKKQLQVISTISTNTHSADYTSLWTVLDEVLVNVCGLGQCTSFMSTTCSPKKQDIVFVIDSSRSIGPTNYRRLHRFTKRLASRLDLAEGRTHLGLLQVGDEDSSRLQFTMGEFPDRSDVLYMINEMSYIDSTETFMGKGLKKIREEIFNRTGGRDRPNIPNTIVLFADGQSHDSPTMFKEAEKLKALGVKIFAVGYGRNVSASAYGIKNLKKLASNRKDVFTIDFKKNDLILEEQIEVVAQHLVQVDCPRAFAPPVQCTQGLIDLFLLVDGSRSITESNFKLVKKFLRKLTSEFDVSSRATHVGLLQFSDKNSMSYEFALNEMKNNQQVKRAIKRMKYRAGSKTNTGDALRIVNKYIFNHRNGDRPNASDVLILFTDGQAHDFEVAKKHAEEMKKRNIRIITIAAGEDSKNLKAQLLRQLEEIASDPLSVYKADFSELTHIVDKLIDIDCFIVP